MTPQRWQGAGILFLAVAAVGVVLALMTVLTATPTTTPTVTGLFDAAAAVLRAVVLGAFAGVAFFLGLASFVWSALVEARQQRAEIIAELTALRER